MLTKEHKNNISKSLIGHITSEETKIKIANSLKGKKHSIEQNNKHSAIMTGRTYLKSRNGKIAVSMKGKVFTQEHRNNISLSHKGKTSWSKGITGRYSKDTIKRMSETKKGKIFSINTKLKQRLSRLAYLEKNGIYYPGYNKQACDYFKKFDEEHNTNGRYAVYGSGEYKIKELGYFVDYINFDLKLIIEYDEKHHYINGQLREKDINRQEEIQKQFPDFEFRRIKS